MHKLTHARIAADAEENLLQHRIGRSYIGNELIEKRVLPAVGYKEPEKTHVEKFMLDVWNREVTDIDCGDMTTAPQQTQMSRGKCDELYVVRLSGNGVLCFNVATAGEITGDAMFKYYELTDIVAAVRETIN